MSSREARRERRAAERKAKKREVKKARLDATAHSLQPRFDPDPRIQPRWNPELEDEFPREVQIRNNALADRTSLSAGLPIATAASESLLAKARERLGELESAAPKPPIGFVPQTNATTPSEPTKRAETNRRNAAHSTGPKSIQGKIASSRNSTKHGLASGTPIIPGEDPAAFDALLLALTQEHQPATATEELLIKEIAQSHWLTERAIRFQNECFTAEGVNEKHLALFLRYQTTHQRAFFKSLNTLRQLKNDRARAERGSVSQPASKSPETCQFVRKIASESGFVSQNEPGSEEIPATLPKTRAA